MFSSNKSWASLRVFCAILSVMFFTKWASGSYLYAMLTTIERAFGLSATEIAGLKSMGGATYSVCMVFVMILAKKVHVPRTIAMASIGMAFAFFIQLIPYLYGAGRGGIADLSGAHNSSLLDDVDVRRPLCYDKAVQSAIRRHQCDDYGADDETDDESGLSPALKEETNREYIFLAAGKIISMILAPFVVILYSPFIDNNVGNRKAAMYISVVKSLQFVGPIVGMGLGSYLSQIPVDLKPVDLKPGDPQFVGAWWIGILIFGPLLLVSSVPMLFFPRRPAEAEKVEAEKNAKGEGDDNNDDDDDDEGGKVEKETFFDKTTDNATPQALPFNPTGTVLGFFKSLWLFLVDFLKNVWQVLTNKMWLCCWSADLISGFGWGGMFTFLPKTLELQYSFPSWQAGLILGVVIGAGGGLGMILSGLIVRRMNLKPPGMALHVIIVRILYVGCLVVMLFLTSDGSNIDGDIDPESRLKVLRTECNSGCNCGQQSFYAICGDDGRNYFSPCHAGCQSVELIDKEYHFFNCTCVGDGVGHAVQGYCQKQTPTKGFVYVIFLFLFMLIACSNSMSQFLLKFRAITDEQKPLSVGLSTLTRSLLGAVVSNMIYGKMIDYSCLIWRENCGIRKNCYFYNMYKYHIIVHSGCAIFSFASTLLYGGAFFFARRRNWDHLEKKKKKEDNKKALLENNNNNDKNNNLTENGKVKEENKKDAGPWILRSLRRGS